MENNPIIIECKRVKFYSAHDEDAFFEWINKLTFISSCKGRKDSILLFINNTNIDDNKFGSLITLFRRYKVNMQQLEIFVTDANKETFLYYQKGYSINVYPTGQ